MSHDPDFKARHYSSVSETAQEREKETVAVEY